MSYLYFVKRVLHFCAVTIGKIVESGRWLLDLSKCFLVFGVAINSQSTTQNALTQRAEEGRSLPRNMSCRDKGGGGMAPLILKFLPSAVMRWRLSTLHSGRFSPGKNFFSQCTVGWMGPSACLDGCNFMQISCPTGIRTPKCPVYTDYATRTTYRKF